MLPIQLRHRPKYKMVRVKRKLKVRYCKSDAKRQKSIEDEYEDDELEGVVSKFGEAQQHGEFESLWSQLPLELKERVLHDLPTSSVVQFARTLSTEWHWTFLGGCHKYPKGFVDTYLRPILLGSILAMIQRYSITISYIRS